MAKVIMIQGTMSNAGKSLIVAGLCRIFKQDGYKVAPFKSQNMALNSYITDEGLEMGRAQVMQAEAAGVKPMVSMNPILLKPTTNVGSQVIVNGEVIGNMPAREYFEYKKQLIPEILKAFKRLCDDFDIIVIEGAGSPAEINLKENDIVNMGMAKMVDAPVILVGDIDRGGVFAQLLGTIMLLEEGEKQRVKGLVINKFRGDKTILDPGIDMLEEKGQIPVVGVVPYMDVAVEDEDSLCIEAHFRSAGKISGSEANGLGSEFVNENAASAKAIRTLINISVIKLPRISNFTDFDVFSKMPGVEIRYVTSVSELRNSDMIIIPGSKNTIDDLKWMRQNGIEAMIKKLSERIPIWGVCGGYQMLGRAIRDPYSVESDASSIAGIGLLPLDTVLLREKTTIQCQGRFEGLEGCFKSLTGKTYIGYEIHMGETKYITGGATKNTVISSGNIYGSYVHGIFDNGDIATEIVKTLAYNKGINFDESLRDFKLDEFDYAACKEKEFDKLADGLRESMNMDLIYSILQEAIFDET